MATRHADTLILGGGFGGIAVAVGSKGASVRGIETEQIERPTGQVQPAQRNALGGRDATMVLVCRHGSHAIVTEREIAAPPDLVHSLLVDVEAWRLWSPHIASVEHASGSVTVGWRGQVRPWFSPVPTTMHVTWVEPGHGMDWESDGLGHVLRYRHRIFAAAGGARVRFEAQVAGPFGNAATRLVGPLSAYGQRRRLERLARLAEFSAGRDPA